MQCPLRMSDMANLSGMAREPFSRPKIFVDTIRRGEGEDLDWTLAG